MDCSHKQYKKMISIGDKIPDIELEALHDNTIKKVKFSKLKGRWLVLLFYPGDFTFICPTELEEAAELYNEFKKHNAEIMSVSTDSIPSHKAWKDTSKAIKKVKYPMLSDPTGKLSKALGTYIEEEGVSQRGTFIFDPNGKLKAFEIHHNDIGRNAKEILRKLKAAKFVSENKGLVCPASWEPGKGVLRPGLDLVGKI